MYIKNMQNRKGFSLQFCDMEELNVFLEFIETYPDPTGRMKILGKKLRFGVSDKYANEITKYSIPLWFEYVPDVMSALWIAYTFWDSSDFGQRAEKAVEHDEKLYDERSKKVEERNNMLTEELLSLMGDDDSSNDNDDFRDGEN